MYCRATHLCIVNKRVHLEFSWEYSIATLFLIFQNASINVYIVVIDMILLLFTYRIQATKAALPVWLLLHAIHAVAMLDQSIFVANFHPSHYLVHCSIFVGIHDKWWIVVICPLTVTYAKRCIWIRLGQYIQPYFRGWWRPCHNWSKGCKYTFPLVIREGPTGTVELAIHVDGGYGHIESVLKMLVLKVPSRIAFKMSKQAIHISLCYFALKLSLVTLPMLVVDADCRW